VRSYADILLFFGYFRYERFTLNLSNTKIHFENTSIFMIYSPLMARFMPLFEIAIKWSPNDLMIGDEVPFCSFFVAGQGTDCLQAKSWAVYLMKAKMNQVAFYNRMNYPLADWYRINVITMDKNCLV